MGIFGKKTANDWCKKGVKLYKDKKFNAAMGNFLLAAEDNHSESQYYIGFLYENGLGVDINYNTALTWYLKAAEQGYSDAQSNVGVFYYRGYGVDQDCNVAAEWLMKAAEKGNHTSEYALGDMFYHGVGFAQSYETAFVWFSTAAKGGDVNAQVSLGRLYREGKGTKQNYAESMKWFKEAADQNSGDAMYQIGDQFYYGQGVTKDYKEAFKWYERSSRKANVIGKVSLGYMYYKGLGVERCLKWAFTLYRMAVDTENDARNNTEIERRYVPSSNSDFNNSFERYKLYAEAGNKCTQMILGIMYLDGFGTNVNLDLAQEWFEKALENGIELAQECIDGVKARKLESQKLSVDSEAETESQREAREAKEQIAILLAKLAVKDSEIEKIKKAAYRVEDAEVPHIIHESVPITSTGIAKAGFTHSGKDENLEKQSHSKKPLMFFELPAMNRDDDTEVPTTSTNIAEAELKQDNNDETPKKPLMFFHL